MFVCVCVRRVTKRTLQNNLALNGTFYCVITFTRALDVFVLASLHLCIFALLAQWQWRHIKANIRAKYTHKYTMYVYIFLFAFAHVLCQLNFR